MTPPWIRIVIVNYNAGPHLRATLDALVGQSATDFEVVIVDNASIDGSADNLNLHDSRFSLLRSSVNLGFAAGCNLGASGSQTPWLAMLNPDAAPETDWLSELKAATLSYPEAAMFGSTQILADNPKLLDGAGDNYSIFGLAWRGAHRQPIPASLVDAEVFAPCGAAALYRRDAFEAASGFAEDFFCYLEDVDLGFRLRLAGHSCIQLARARVHHAVGVCSAGISSFAAYHGARNAISLMVRCLPLPLLALAFPLHLLAMSVNIMLRPQNGGAKLKGLLAGVARLPNSWRQRLSIQAKRRLRVGEVSRLLAWHPWRIARREVIALSPISPPVLGR
jgi:N-acetylglucosaminyl-diphospho-decaprenol L-rhamnosyltransferase